MKFAVIKNNYVENLIVANGEQKEELEAALNAELVDAAPYGLMIGDLRVSGRWTRNEDGEQTILTENATYDELLAYIEELEELIDDLAE